MRKPSNHRLPLHGSLFARHRSAETAACPSAGKLQNTRYHTSYTSYEKKQKKKKTRRHTHKPLPATHKADPVLLRDDAVDQLHLPEDSALPALTGPQQQQLDLLLLRFVVLRFRFVFHISFLFSKQFLLQFFFSSFLFIFRFHCTQFFVFTVTKQLMSVSASKCYTRTSVKSGYIVLRSTIYRHAFRYFYSHARARDTRGGRNKYRQSLSSRSAQHKNRHVVDLETKR